MDKDKTGLVVKSNKLVEASYRLDLIEQRIILAAIVEARESQKGLENGFITLEAKRFCQTFGMEEGSVYGQLKTAMDTLFNRFIVVRDIHPESGYERVSKIRWISKASYIDGAGMVQLQFGQDIVPYISRLEKEFTPYRLEKIGAMTSAHAVRLYELLIQYLDIGERAIEIAWLRDVLQLEGQYTLFNNFKIRVIDVAVDQINEHSDLKVSYTQRRTGRSITHLIFSIKAKPEPKKAKIGPKPIKLPESVTAPTTRTDSTEVKDARATALAAAGSNKARTAAN